MLGVQAEATQRREALGYPSGGRGTQAGAPSSQGTAGRPTSPPTGGKLEEVEEGTSSPAEGETGCI